MSQRVIASEIARSKTVIVNFSKDPDAYGTKKHTGWPKNISLALGTRIRRKVRKSSRQSSNQFKAHSDAQCSTRTIRRHLRANDFKNHKRLQQHRNLVLEYWPNKIMLIVGICMFR